MKKLYLLPLAAAALGFTACSSDDNFTADSGAAKIAEGGYVKVAINLPTEVAQKGINDDFNDGLASEYAINDATLILFQGDSEDGATFHSAYDITHNMSMYGTATDNVTSITKLVKEVNSKKENKGNNLYALVILNKNNILPASISASGQMTLSIAGNKLTAGKTTLADIKKYTTGSDASAFNESGFFMTNAPLSSAKGGSDDPGSDVVAYLTEIDGDKIYSTQAEAQANPAADIYVERGVAKVTMSNTINGNATSTLTGTAYTGDNAVTCQIAGWTLDVTNKSTFVLHNYDENWNSLATNATTVSNPYRFIGSTQMPEKELYRTYWGIDPNYDGDAYTDAFTKLSSEPTVEDTFGNDNPQYCLENTFNVEHQNQDETTRVIVKVKLTPAVTTDVTDGSFYIVGDDETTFYTYETMQNAVKAGILSNTTVLANHKGEAMNAESVHIKFDDMDKTTNTIKVLSFTVTGTKADGTTNEMTYDATSASAVIDAINAGFKITDYVGGYAYYPIRIQHFGNDLTPWNNEETPAPKAGTSTDAIYPEDNRDANYLGRYGVLRNNWYDISVSSIKGLGSAVVPEIPADGTPDDELSNYISVRINVLSWAKRTQSAEL